MKPTKEQVAKRFENKIELAQHTLDKFKATFSEDPSYAFEWSDSAFTAAAEVNVFGSVVRSLKHIPAPGEPEVTIETIRAHATEQALRRAHYPSHSTSVPSNHMYQSVTSAWAEVIELLKYL